MSSQIEVIPIADLLAPIEGGNPSGVDHRYSGLYDEIREARRSEDSGDWDWKPSAKAPNWEQVICISMEALTCKTKDLYISMWLAEALARTKGFPGVRDGLKLMRLIIDRYWDTLYPEIDDGDFEARACILTWLDRQLEIVIRELPITDSLTGPGYSYNQWQESRRYEIPENTEDPEFAQLVRDGAARENKITSEQWRTARDGTSTAFYKHLKLLVMECWEELRFLGSTVDAHFGLQAPELGATRQSLKDIGQLLDAQRRASRSQLTVEG